MVVFLWYRWELWIALAILLAGLALPQIRLPGARFLRLVLRRRWLSVAVVGGVAALGAIGLTVGRGVPVPDVHDEFAYLLQADTFAHARLTNPPHPCGEFFDTMHVLQKPTYAAKYPPAQAMFLTSGQLMRLPVLGVWLSFSAACAATCWMLQAWLPRRWALVGALFLTVKLLVAPVLSSVVAANNWAHSYWGGAVAMLGGALLFGAGRRLFARPSKAHAVVLALGLGLLANSRPMEGFITCLPMMAALIWQYLFRRATWRLAGLTQLALPCAAVLILIGAWMAYYNYRVTGNASSLPYKLHLKQYLATPVFCWQTPPIAPTYSCRELERFYVEWDRAVWHDIHSLNGWARITWMRLCKFSEYFFGWLFLPICFCGMLSMNRWRWFALGTCLLVLGVVLQLTWFSPHYLASIASLFAYFVAAGMQTLWRWRLFGKYRVRGVLILAAMAYAFLLVSCVLPVGQIPRKGFQFARAKLLTVLNSNGDKNLVVIRYAPTHHVHDEWVFNDADIDNSRVVWAREKPPEQMRKLLTHFGDRLVWLLEVDRSPLKLRPYSMQTSGENSKD